MKLLIYVTGLALGALATTAGAQNIAPGTYVYQGGNGSLLVKANRTFVISTVGGNGHICDVEGTLVGNSGKSTENRCVLTLKPIAENWHLDTNGDQSCREYCGARAGFDGLYIKPDAACTSSAIANSRRIFKSNYDHKEFSLAVQILAPVLSQCTQVLNRFDENWIRNDVALAQLRGGDAAACLNTLAPLVEIATMSDDDIRGLPEPTYISNYLDIAKAVRTNLRLCRKSGQ